jgi:hypothetical protein
MSTMNTESAAELDATLSGWASGAAPLDKAAWLAWRAAWRASYRALSARLRELRIASRDPAATASARGAAQSARHYRRREAREMMDVLGRGKAARDAAVSKARAAAQ